MSKTPQEDLVEPVASELLSFLKEGEINPKFVEKHLQFKGVDRLQDLDSILRIHFVLSDPVIAFLKKLPERVRRIKTESKKQTTKRRGEVKGKINWSRTIPEQRAQHDRSVFIYQNPSKNYDMSENLVLKKLLSIIFLVLDEDLEKPLEKNYSWLKGLQGKQDIVATLKHIFRRNVHVNRISGTEEFSISERDLARAENSRKGLYKDAADLLKKYNMLMEGDYKKKDFEILLNETLVLPKDAATIFELYAVFKLVRMVGKNFRINKIEEGSKEIATFEEAETKVLVYHDSTGGMSFFEELDSLRGEKANVEFLEQYRKARLKHAHLINELIGRESETLYSGRPDILIEYYKNGRLTNLCIGEVKYTDLKETFSQGLKELIQYIYFVRQNEGYFINNDDSDVTLEGVLVVDDMEYVNIDKLEEISATGSDTLELTVYDTESLAEV